MYWLLSRRRDSECELTIDEIPQIVSELDVEMGEYRSFDLALGNYIDIKPPVIDIPYTMDSTQYKGDSIIAADCLGLVINKKIKSAFDGLNIKNIQYFPARLIDKQTKEVDDEYCLANIVGKYACVDMEASQVSLYESNNIRFIDKLVLNMDRSVDYGHIFRMSEFMPLLVISNELKEALEANSISGLKIYKPEEYSV